MHSVDMLEHALELARQAGFEIRQQWLDDSVGGACRIGKRWVLFVNEALTAEEQLSGLIVAMRRSGQKFDTASCHDRLKYLLGADTIAGC